MIRVNLLRSRVPIGGDQGLQGVESTDFVDSSPGDEGGNAIKIVLILLFIGLLMLYEHFNVSGLQERNRILKAKVTSLDQDLARKKRIADQSKQHQKEIKELEDKVEALKQLSKKRMREIKALDYLQTTIPEKVWFSEINYQDDTVDLKGFSVTDEDLANFTSKLEAKSYFSKVIILQSKEVKKPKMGPVMEFQIQCSMEMPI